jgi:hypothetical protein
MTTSNIPNPAGLTQLSQGMVRYSRAVRQTTRR